MAVIIFLIVTSVILLIDRIRNKQFLSPVAALTVPYMVIITVNNIFAVRFGFFEIRDEVIFMLLLGITMFFLGNCFFGGKTAYAKIVSDNEAIDKFQYYNMNAMKKYAIFVEIMILVRLASAVGNYGLAWFVSDENEGYLMSGPIGHLMLTLYVVIPILFYYWLKHKSEKIYLFVSIVGVAAMFMTFVKYHVICLIVIMYLFVVAEDKTYLKKGAIIIVTVCISSFILSYVVTFILRNAVKQVDNSFYFYHLWKYIAGSIINDNRIFTSGIRTDMDIFYKIGTIIFAFPNMFLFALGFERICPTKGLSMYAVASNGEASNVVDFIGYMFPSKGNFIDVFGFCLFMLLFGILARHIYCKDMRRKKTFRISGWIFMTFFCFFSFFAVYGTLSNPWEILIYSVIIPPIFSGNIRFGGLSLKNEKTGNYNS